jgi:hypothetical protein
MTQPTLTQDTVLRMALTCMLVYPDHSITSSQHAWVLARIRGAHYRPGGINPQESEPDHTGRPLTETARGHCHTLPCGIIVDYAQRMIYGREYDERSQSPR